MIADLHPQAGLILALVLVGMIGLPIAGWWFLYRAEWKHRPTSAEIGSKPIATFRTGLRMGAWQTWSFPLVRVSVYHGFAVIVPSWAPMVGPGIVLLRTEDGVRLAPGRHLWSRNLRILHARKDVPSILEIVARPHERQALSDALQLGIRARLEPAAASARR